MDSRTARKRSWEQEESPVDPSPLRRDSNAVAGHPPLHPQHPHHVGDYSRDSQALSQRRLPPLYAPSGTAPTEPRLMGSLLLSAPVHASYDLGKTRPRSQSLFDVFQDPKRQRLDSSLDGTGAVPGALDLDRSLPPDEGTGTHRPRFGTDPTPPHAAVICCPSNCEGQECSDTHTLLRELASELVLLDARVRSILRKDPKSTNKPPESRHSSTSDSLRWALELVQCTNLDLRHTIEHPNLQSPERSPLRLEALPTMRRGQHPLDREERSPPTRHPPGAPHGYPSFAHPGTFFEDRPTLPYGNEMPSMTNSPHHTASSAGSVFPPPQSPMQAQPSSRSAMLPSPSSMNFSNAPNLPSISSPSTASQAQAQASHLQDLQHQVSVKTLAFQTLQREYDNLLQKLERQRTKCATLEKKFEVSDIEINSLTDEKEKLQFQVSALESQVEDLQKSRDEARSQLVANGSQYMRIMEMASRLQSQSAEDKKRWETERSELEQRIRILEEAMVTGQGSTGDMVAEAASAVLTSPDPSVSNPRLALSASSPSTETVNVLRAEIGRLRARTQTLETALQAMRQESLSIQDAARQLMESGGKIEKTVQGSLGG